MNIHKLHNLLLHHAGQGIYGIGVNGEVTFINPAAQHMLGYSSAQVLGKKLHPIIHSRHANGCIYHEADCPLHLTLADGKTRHIVDEVFWHLDGSAVYVDYIAAALFDNGRIEGAVILFSDITELKKKQALLLKSEQRLRRLNHYQERLREQERSHIAREVHDELGQLLTALRMDTALLMLKYGKTGHEFADDIVRMKSTIDSCIAAVRHVVSSLRPAALDMGLLAAADWLLQQFKQRSGLQVVFKCPLTELKLDDARATAVFRVIQESLTNISRHAKASQVELDIEIVEGVLKVCIKDNGCGFDSALVRKKPGFGLMGIRERVMTFGGTARFDAILGQGTEVCIQLPLAKGCKAEVLG